METPGSEQRHESPDTAGVRRVGCNSPGPQGWPSIHKKQGALKYTLPSSSGTHAEHLHWRVCALRLPCCNVVSGRDGLFTGGGGLAR
jgi:hypothetical protein